MLDRLTSPQMEVVSAWLDSVHFVLSFSYGASIPSQRVLGPALGTDVEGVDDCPHKLAAIGAGQSRSGRTECLAQRVIDGHQFACHVVFFYREDCVS